MKGVLEYLKELSEIQSESLLKNIVTFKIPIQIKLANDDKISTFHLAKGDAQQLRLVGKTNRSMTKPATFKIVIDNDVYFFKTEILNSEKTNYIEKKVTIYQLARRKEPRYQIPVEWKQKASVLASDQMKLNVMANILEFSLSGMKVHAYSDFLKFEKENIIKVQLKIHKRGEVTVTGVIRHIRRNKSGGFTLGIEFLKNDALTRGKIQSISDDLFFYYTHLSKLTHK